MLDVFFVIGAGGCPVTQTVSLFRKVDGTSAIHGQAINISSGALERES
ncbi:hypothetical protein [Arthrobacter sp. NEB 688]|nr:hypothetical protein [Arthrobacter sp. NEB 688]QKE82873.1 hypothetical protein HL663_02180 [Arthrobacter sp. NEB 688]